MVKTVSSGTYTLTSSEASNTVQKYVSSGNLAGNVTIVVPPTIQIYYIQNATTTASSYTVTISTGVSGGANAIIASNQQSTLLCDGTNLVNANTLVSGNASYSLTDGSAAGPSLYFGTETNTGVYRAGAGQWDVSVLGTQRLAATASGISVTGSGTFSAGVSGGTF